MAACGESNYSNWLSESLEYAQGEGTEEDEIIVQAVRRELADRYSTIEERMAAVEKILSSRQAPPVVSSDIAEPTTSPPPPVSKPTKKKASIARKPAYKAAPPLNEGVSAYHNYDSDTSGVDTQYWDVVQIRSLDSSLSTVTAGRGCCSNKKWRWICIAIFLAALIGVAVTVPLVLMRNKDKRSSDSSAIIGTPTEQFTAAPTSAPTSAPVGLPPECEPLSDDVGVCLAEELGQENASSCVDCVWRFLPDKTGYCEQLERQVCSVVESCGCETCSDELIAYLDCQTECKLDCVL